MSITLRDAQNLCVKNARMIKEKLDIQRGKGWTAFGMVTGLLEEAGEVASVVRGLERARYARIGENPCFDFLANDQSLIQNPNLLF